MEILLGSEHRSDDARLRVSEQEIAFPGCSEDMPTYGRGFRIVDSRVHISPLRKPSGIGCRVRTLDLLL